MLGKSLCQSSRYEAVLHQEVDVGDLVEGHDVGFEAFDDGARLLRRAGMRLVDGDILAGVGLVFRREGSVLLSEEFARDVVGGVEDLVLGNGRAGQERGKGCAGEDKAFHDVSLKGSMDFGGKLAEDGPVGEVPATQTPPLGRIFFRRAPMYVPFVCANRPSTGYGKKIRKT